MPDHRAPQDVSVTAKELELSANGAIEDAERFREAMEWLSTETRVLAAMCGTTVAGSQTLESPESPGSDGERPAAARAPARWPLVAGSALAGAAVVLAGFGAVSILNRRPVPSTELAPLADLPHMREAALSILPPAPPSAGPASTTASTPAHKEPALVTAAPTAAPPATAPPEAPLATPPANLAALIAPQAPAFASPSAPVSTPVPVAANPEPAAAATVETSFVSVAMRSDILARDARWFQAFYAGDAAAMRALTHDGFRLIDLRPVNGRIDPQVPGIRRRLERASVEIEGDALVMVGRMVEETAAGNRSVSDVSEVWGTDGTDWKMIGMRITPARTAAGVP